MEVLKPLIDKGRHRCRLRPDGHQADRDPGLEGGERPAADGLAADLTYNGGKKLDGVLSPNDTLARAIITSVKGAGKPVPVVTGQDSEVESVKSIMAGEQYSTINKDTRKLVAETIKMVQKLQAGETPEINDTKSYDNGVKIVPSYLLAADHRDQGERRAGLRRRPEAGSAHQVES
jgi:putative multiple sugar transport system substrate-binding protein